VLPCCSWPDKGECSQDLFIGYFLDSGKEKSASDPFLGPGSKYLKMPLADAANIGLFKPNHLTVMLPPRNISPLARV
jgi:hypothetical protein